MSKVKKGYRDTEIGIIPKDWQIRNVAKYCSIKARIGWQGLTKSEYQKNGNYILITGTDFQNGIICWKTCSFVSRYRYEQDKNIQIQDGDILITKDGTIGKVAYVERLTYPSTLNSGVFVIRPLSEDINKTYLSLIFKSKYFTDFLNKLIAGSTINHLYQKDFINFDFPTPNTQEQQAIAEALSDIDALINALNKQIEKKKNIKQGAVQKLLTPKANWETKTIEDISCIIGGGTPSTFNLDFWDGKINWFTPTEVGTKKYLFSSQRKITELGLKNSAARMLPINTILLTTRAGIGDIGILKQPAATNQGFQSIICKDIVDNEFIYYLMSTKKEDLLKNASGSTFLEISSQKIKNLEITIPKSKEEQTAIAQILTDMDNEIEQFEKKRDKYLNIKSGMMQQLLTGQIRLTNAASYSGSKEIKIENLPSNKKKHSKQFDEAVIISFLVDEFGTVKEPLSRFMYTKLSYLIHRKHDCKVVDFKKFAAGPYNPKSRYGGPESIGKEKKYFDSVKDAKGYDAFAPMENIQEAVDYFTQWYGADIQNWAQQFRQYKPWDLETLATVDMAVYDLREKGIESTVNSVKTYLSSIPKWQAKLNKPHFSDRHIQHAIDESIRLFKI
jgi:type I restriction enzyme S subunit